MTGFDVLPSTAEVNADIFFFFAHTKVMEVTILLSLLYLAITATVSLKRFAAYSLIFSTAFCVLSTELISGINGLSICLGLAAGFLYLLSVKLSAKDVLLWGLLTAVLTFWLSTREFLDGFAFSYLFVSIILAELCNLLFDKKNRQSLCVTALLTALAICLILKNEYYAADISSSVVISLALTDCYITSRDKEKSLLNSLY